MTEQINLNVTVRDRVGKGGAREARRNGFVPGVLYGGDLDPVAINVKKNELTKAISSGKFLSTTVNLIHEGAKQLVIPQAVQVHPVTDQPEHIDLFRVRADQIIAVEVPVHFVGEEVAPGLKKGGTLNVVRFSVELHVMAGNIPESIEADVSKLEIGDNVKISDVNLPEGISPTITDRDFTIATIAGRSTEPATEQESTEETAEEGEKTDGTSDDSQKS